MSSVYIKNYQDILMALPQAVFVTGEVGIVRFLNASAKNLMSGFGIKQVLEQKLVKYLNNPDFIEVYEDVRTSETATSTVTFSLKTEILATKHYFSANISKMLIDDKILIVIILNDITPLREAENMRADFIANISHELRTPLSSILGFVEVL